MKRKILAAFGVGVVLAYGGFEYLRAPDEISVRGLLSSTISSGAGEKTLEERIADAKERSKNIKGLYMTAAVANDQGRAATYIREQLFKLAETTELNGFVIDVKETEGAEITQNLKPFLGRLKEKNIWTIARIATFRDNSQIKEHPDFYLKRPDGRIWRDNKGNAWLDPMSSGVRQYIVGFSKTVADLGFDELQYDYIRFPSDGDTRNIVYPAYQASSTPKYEALADFFSYLNNSMKFYKPELILSADLFGYVAIQKEDLGIGQRLEDIGNSFDYVSLMLYPSHFYSGFYVPADALRGLPALSIPYRGKTAKEDTAARPGEVILRSLYMATDILAGLYNEVSTSTPNVSVKPKSNAKIRPWLQDFNLGPDSAREINYDATAVRAQIDAAEKAGASGWLLWSPTNTYTEGALLHPPKAPPF